MMIFCRSRKAAERTLRHLKPYVEGKLFLKLNEQKTKICRMTDPNLSSLGLAFGKARHRESTTASEVQGQMQTAPEGHYLTQSRQKLEAYRKELKAFVCGMGQLFRGVVDGDIRQKHR